MRQTTTGELPRAERTENGMQPRKPATRRFGCKRKWLRSNSAVARLDHRENHAQWTGNLGIFRFLTFVAAVLLLWPLSGVFAGSAAASEGDEPAQPASFATWHTDNFFTQCDGDCAVSVFGGPQLLTHQYDIFVHFEPAWEWRFGNADLIGGAISRRLLTLWDSLDIESEFGVAKRFGNMHTEEAWLVLNFRWTRFPWNQYLRTSIAITSGPSFAVDLPRNTHKNATILNYFSPQITFALPQYPQYELMVQIHHRSNIVDFGKGGTPDPGWQFLTVGLHYRF